MGKRKQPGGRRLKTGVLCTLGPASSSSAVLVDMINAGMDAVRINFSHGSHKEHLQRIESIRQINRKTGRRAVKIMADLEGPRIRVGRFKSRKNILLQKKQTVYMVKEAGSSGGKYIPFDYPGELWDIEPAEFIYIDDGNIVLGIEAIETDRIKAKVVSGGILKEKKGVNIPGASLNFPALSEKDKKDIDFSVENRVDYIAQSFVRSPSDMLELKKYASRERAPLFVSKIECQEGIDNIDGIIDVSDGVMIARGDMGISIPVHRVPFVQKDIIRRCAGKGRFSITATQMLESMTENPFPTRAEVSDVANAVLDGTGFVMLSAETSIGSYPVKCVKMMTDIINYAENYIQRLLISSPLGGEEHPRPEL